MPEAIEKNSEFDIIYGVPENSAIPNHSLVVLDDLQSFWQKDTLLLFTVYSHHKNITVIALAHNLFSKNKFARDVTLSTKYLILKRSPRDIAQYHHFARQVAGHKSKQLISALQDACTLPYSYLLVDLTQRAHPSLKYRTNILPSDPNSTVYATEKDILDLVRSDSRYERYRD